MTDVCTQPRKEKNVYGQPLKPCRRPSNASDAYGSWDSAGTCSDRDGDDPGAHQICFRVEEDSQNFSENTGQSGWSRDRLGKNHCMCLGAYALYKARQASSKRIREGEAAIGTSSNEVVCEALPEAALSSKYVDKWKRWNGHEHAFELHKTHRLAVDSIYEQCKREAPDEAAGRHLDRLYKCNA